MRRLVSLVAFVLFAASARGQTPVDGYVNLGASTPSPSTPGTQLTATILGNGSVGAVGTWNFTGTASAATVGTHNPNCNLGTPVSVSGSTYVPAAQSQAAAFDNGSNFTYWTFALSGGHQTMSISACITFGGIPGTNSLMDMMRVDGTAGGYAVAQLKNNPTGCFNIETNGPVHSGCITLSSGGTYWCSLLVDAVGGTAKLSCFNPTPPFAQVGSTVTASQFTGSNYGTINKGYIGNVEVGVSAGTTNTFENVVFDFTNAAYPLGVGTLNTLWAGVLNPSRAIDWTAVGVNGGIPDGNWTQCGSTIIPASSTITALNSAIAACGANQFVNVAAGTFPSSTTALDYGGKSNVVVRGAGANQTFLSFSGGTACGGQTASVCMRANDSNFKTSPTNLVNWTAGYLPGTTVITLASVPNLVIGNPIILDQCDSGLSGAPTCTGTVTDVGAILVTDSTSTGTGVAPGSSGPYSLSGNGGGAARSGRMQEQIVTVVGCNGSTTPGFACSGTSVPVTISPGLYMPNWSSGQSPQAWWATSPALQEGLENLSVDSTNNSGVMGVRIVNCLNCWVKGVRSIDTAEAHIRIDYSARCTIRDNYLFLTQNTVTSSYGFESYSGSDCLIENNIIQAVASPLMYNGPCPGCVMGYNFTVNNFYTVGSLYNQNQHGDHTAGNEFGLYEGNVGNRYDADVIHGTHNLQTIFRNRLAGTQPSCYSSGYPPYSSAVYGTCNNDLMPIRPDAFSRFYNVLGNILGTTGTNTTYSGSNITGIYVIGSGNGAVPSDSNVGTTLLRWGNCDSANGFGSCQFSNSEIPNALTGVQEYYSSTIPANHTLAASFYYSAKPAWWPSAKAWPPIGPDVSGGNISGVGGLAYTIPAQDCYLNIMSGPSDGTGAVLSFNAATCYGVASNPTFGSRRAFGWRK